MIVYSPTSASTVTSTHAAKVASRPATAHLRRARPSRQVCDRRVELMELAVELEVDKSDFEFYDRAEEALWDELQVEFERRLERFGPTWVAEVDSEREPTS